MALLLAFQSETPAERTGTGALALTLAALGAATVLLSAAGSAPLTLSATGAGAMPVAASGSYATTQTASGAGTVLISGSGAATVTLAASGAGAVAISGIGSDARTLLTVANGAVLVSGAGLDTRTLSTSGSGLVAPSGISAQGSLSLAVAFTGTGEVADLEEEEASPIANSLWYHGWAPIRRYTEDEKPVEIIAPRIASGVLPFRLSTRGTAAVAAQASGGHVMSLSVASTADVWPRDEDVAVAFLLLTAA